MKDRRRLLWTPSPWLWVVVAMLWAFRGTSLLARSGYDFTPSAWSLFGLLWDLLLVGAGQVVVRAVLLARGPLPPTALRVAGMWLGALGLLVSAVLRGADVAYAALSGLHWDSPGFRYLAPENFELLTDGHGAGMLAVVTGVLCFGGFALWRDQRWLLTRAPATAVQPAPRLRGHVALAAALWLGVWALGFGADDNAPGRFVPESNFAYHLGQWYGVFGSAAVFQPDPQTLRRLRAHGLAPRAPLRNDYPLLRRAVDPSPFPHPAKAGAAERPNVVFTLVEQLNHDFVHSFSGQFPRLMPELSALSKRMTMVTDYRSTTAPTIHGLTGAFCSVYGNGHHRRLNDGEGTGALANTPMTCLPALLRAQGYRTVFIQGGRKTFSGKQEFLLAQGFEEMHGMREVLGRYPEPPPWHWGAHDVSLMRYVQDEIKRLEALRAKDGRPYFIGMLTLDTHAPGKIPWTHCHPEKWVTELGAGDVSSEFMARALHCSDKEFGKLGRFLLDDPERKRSTVWMLTGDHPTYALSFVRKAYRKRGRAYRGWVERLPLLIHDPRHALPKRVPVLSGHTDLAPTLLHMLGLGELDNAMTGYSIFGLRPQFPLLVGRQGPGTVALFTPRDYAAVRMTRLERLCETGAPVLRRDPDALSACDLHAWALWQQSLWRARRITPVIR